MANWARVKHNWARAASDLTRGERRTFYFLLALVSILPPAGFALLILGRGAARAVGIGLLIAVLLMNAVPVGPLFKAHVRRRQQRNRDSSRRS